MELNIPIKKGSKTNAVIRLLNPFLSTLSDNEINIVATIIDAGITNLKGSNRANVRLKLRMGKFNFNNYVLNLKKKGIILKTDEDLIINPQIISLTEQDSYNITFTEG